MNAAEEDTTYQYPEGYREPSKHSCCDRAGNRACAGNGGEVMTHEDRSFCRYIIDAIFHGVSRGRDVAFAYAPLLNEPAAIENITAQQDD